jgi:hypothetical protein
MPFGLFAYILCTHRTLDIPRLRQVVALTHPLIVSLFSALVAVSLT